MAVLLLRGCDCCPAFVVAVGCQRVDAVQRVRVGQMRIKSLDLISLSVCRCVLQVNFEVLEHRLGYHWDGVLDCPCNNRGTRCSMCAAHHTRVDDLGQVELDLDDPDLISDSDSEVWAPRSSSSSEGSSLSGSAQPSPAASE